MNFFTTPSKKVQGNLVIFQLLSFFPQEVFFSNNFFLKAALLEAGFGDLKPLVQSSPHAFLLEHNLNTIHLPIFPFPDKSKETCSRLFGPFQG